MQNNLAAMQRAAGRYADAETTAREALATTIAAVGADHYLVGVAKLGLGGALADRGDTKGALIELRDAHALLSAKLGAQHQDTLLAQAALANALCADGQVHDARAQADAALDAAQKAFPAGHPRLGRIRLAALVAATSEGDCAAAQSNMDAAAKELAAAGASGAVDRAWLAVARALREHGARRRSRTHVRRWPHWR
jgi:tetratricopeptide (TPR) repeat protein